MYVNILENPQDKFLIYSLFYGVYGKKAQDILTMKKNQIDLLNGTITLKDRVVVMDENMKKLAAAALDQNEYMVLDKGGSWSVTSFKFNMDSEYVFKTKPSTKNNKGLNHMSYDGLITRLKNISFFLGTKDVTATTLTRSGYIYRMNEEVGIKTISNISEWMKKNDIKGTPYIFLNVCKTLYKNN